MFDLSADLGNVVIQPRMECNHLYYGQKGERVAKINNLLMKKQPVLWLPVSGFVLNIITLSICMDTIL
jgi:hypothetical protein